MRIGRLHNTLSVVFLLALTLLWPLHCLGHTFGEPLPHTKTVPTQISELHEAAAFSVVLIERDTKAAPAPLALEFPLRDRSSSENRFAFHAITKHLLHDQFLFSSYLIYTETTSSRL